MSGTVLRGGGSETSVTEVARLRRSSGGMKLRGSVVERLRAGGVSETTEVVEFALRKDVGGSYLRGTAGGRLRADEETITGPGNQTITPIGVGTGDTPWDTSEWGTSEWGVASFVGSVDVTPGTLSVIPEMIDPEQALGLPYITLNVSPASFDPEFPDGSSFEAQVGTPFLTNSTDFTLVIPEEIFAGQPSVTDNSGDPGLEPPEADVEAFGVGSVVVVVSAPIDVPVPPNEGGLRDIPNQRFRPQKVRVARAFPRRVRT